LLTAVFGKATILNLFLPTEEESSASSPPSLNELIPTVAITGNGFILGKGKGKVERISLKNNFHDFSELRGHLLELRKEQGVSKSIIILPEAGIRYQLLISTMDICRQYKDEDGTIHALFPIISLGEYQATIAQKS
jgi:hypothetical protein